MGRAKEQLDSTLKNDVDVCVKCGEEPVEMNDSLICEDCTEKFLENE